MTEPKNERSLEAAPKTAKRPAKRKTKETPLGHTPQVSAEVENTSVTALETRPARKPRAKATEKLAAPVPSPAMPADSALSDKPKPTRTRKLAGKKPLSEPAEEHSERVHEEPLQARAQETSGAPEQTKSSETKLRRKKASSRDSVSESGESSESSKPSLEAPASDTPAPAEGKPKNTPRKRRQPEAAPQAAESAPHAQEHSSHQEGGETWSPGERAAAPSLDPVKKPYPVYVPLHVAKQMEQEGKAAPLAVAPDARQAAEIRAASYENRHGGSHSGQAVATAHPREEHGRGQRHERPAERPPQDRQERGGDRGPQGRHGDRHERGGNERHDRNDRKRSRHDRRREGRDEHHPRHHDGPHAHDSSRELPPPTPEELSDGEGIIEISGKGFGFLRDRSRNYVQSPADIFVSPEMVRRFNLRDGQWIKGTVRKSGRGQQIHEIHSVNGDAPEASKLQPVFDELTVINPSEPLWMATTPEKYTTRIIDMVAPIGKGQRGLIVAPPRTGKTTFLQHIAEAMMKNHPEVQLIMLLVDERPEEVTEIRHTVPKAEIMASSNDMDVRSHTRIAELAIERAKRLVEAGKDVFILLDSITRLGRAFNNAMTNGGRTMSGGIDARAMETPRKLFAAARNTEEAGSLTIIATALIETGSRMDEIIFQEFKGTGNMELVLDRKIAEQRIYPAVDIFQSGTRREELLVPADTLHKIHFLRRGLAGCRPSDAIDRLLFYLKKFQTNDQMLREIRG
jgi:transcription termination factor Rho